MENDVKPAEKDITREQYKGPSSAIVGLGYYSAAHHLLNIGAVLGLGTLGYTCHEFFSTQLSKIRRVAETFDHKHAGKRISSVPTDWLGTELGGHPLRHSVERVKSAFAMVETFDFKKASARQIDAFKKEFKALDLTKDELHEMTQILREDERGSFQRIASDFIGLAGGKDRLKNATNYKRVEAGLLMAGFGMVASMIGSLIFGLTSGTHKGHSGRRQFERARTQVSNLKEDNADLNRINDELHERYVKAASRLDHLDALANVSSGDPTLVSAEPAAQLLPGNASIQVEDSQHHGKLTVPERTHAVA